MLCKLPSGRQLGMAGQRAASQPERGALCMQSRPAAVAGGSPAGPARLPAGWAAPLRAARHPAWGRATQAHLPALFCRRGSRCRTKRTSLSGTCSPACRTARLCVAAPPGGCPLPSACGACLDEQGGSRVGAGGDGGSQGAQDGGRLRVAPVVQDVAQEEAGRQAGGRDRGGRA